MNGETPGKEEGRKKADLVRREMPKQPPEVRRRNFGEVALGYTPDLAVNEAKRCMQCKKPRCVSGCPVEIDIPAFISHVTKGDFAAGIKKLKEKNCLPAVSGRVCPQETQCESRCVLKNKQAEIAIGRIERFLADWEAARGEIEVPPRAKPTGKRVAVVGAGPAGITVAGDLILLGHEVTVFEALHKAGGVLTYGIPEFRLPKSVVAREVDYVRRLGVNVVADFVVGKTRSVDELLETYDALFVGTGAGLPWFMNIPGENLNGVYSANEYLTRMNLMSGYLFPSSATPVKKHTRVAVVGGGNVAMDSARTALRMGAEEVYIVYRRSHAELPARLEESENAEEEGVVFKTLTLPVRYIGDQNGWVREMECLRMELGEPDASGRRAPVEVKGSHFRTAVDAVVCAIGNSPNPLVQSTTPGLRATGRGTLVADPETGKTTRDRIWAGGDIVTGAATVILAMGAGRKAARSIHAFLCEGVPGANRS
jgi:glutamate synthase (NADPH/NADH) small chain